MNSENSVTFKTIAIENLILSYIIIFLIALLIYWITDFQVHYLFFLLLPILLNFIFSGKIRIKILGDHLETEWLKKPIFSRINSEKIPYSEIIRWRYRTAFRGPDEFLIILASGRKIKLRPSIFDFQNLYKELFLKLGQKIDHFLKDVSKEDRFEMIKNSVYVKGLQKKLNVLNTVIYILIAIVLLLLILGAIRDSDSIWIAFFSFFLLLVLSNLWYYFTKLEFRDCLRREN